VDELERAGHPVVRIAVDDPYAAETPVSPGTGSSSSRTRRMRLNWQNW
jgi:hypothetical protein